MLHNIYSPLVQAHEHHFYAKIDFLFAYTKKIQYLCRGFIRQKCRNHIFIEYKL